MPAISLMVVLFTLLQLIVLVNPPRPLNETYSPKAVFLASPVTDDAALQAVLKDNEEPNPPIPRPQQKSSAAFGSPVICAYFALLGMICYSFIINLRKKLMHHMLSHFHGSKYKGASLLVGQ